MEVKSSSGRVWHAGRPWRRSSWGGRLPARTFLAGVFLAAGFCWRGEGGAGAYG
jgi:hypothetical protein